MQGWERKVRQRLPRAAYKNVRFNGWIIEIKLYNLFWEKKLSFKYKCIERVMLRELVIICWGNLVCKTAISNWSLLLISANICFKYKWHCLWDAAIWSTIISLWLIDSKIQFGREESDVYPTGLKALGHLNSDDKTMLSD